eukprot:scaffold8192_cov19-Phaeocystis_antarctica.AAC.1
MPAAPPFDVWGAGRDVAAAEGLVLQRAPAHGAHTLPLHPNQVLQLMERTPPAAEEAHLGGGFSEARYLVIPLALAPRRRLL